MTHKHTDNCWEPDSGCDMGRNAAHVKVHAPTLDEKIAALPKVPPTIPHDAGLYAVAMSARLVLLRDTLQAMVDDCWKCGGHGVLRKQTKAARPCPACADARKVLEATK